MSEGGRLDSFKAFEAEGWGDRAETYGDLLGSMTARTAEPLLDAAGVRHDMRVLDVATGPGYAAERAAARGAHPVGIDIAEGMLALARRRRPELEFRWSDAEELPFEDGSFDAVVGGFVVNHLPHPERAMAGAARVLAPGGAVAFSVWDRPERNRLNGVFRDAMADVRVPSLAEIEQGPDPTRFSDDPEFVALLEGAGLREATVETISLTLTVPDADTLWDGFMGSSVRTRAQVDAQPQDVRRRIREAFEHRVEAHRHPAGLEIPVVVKLASARKH
ncbi:MAG: methyltransferase domain-containing protein [Solirubrobacterales bacterium]